MLPPKIQRKGMKFPKIPAENTAENIYKEEKK